MSNMIRPEQPTYADYYTTRTDYVTVQVIVYSPHSGNAQVKKGLGKRFVVPTIELTRWRSTP